MNKIAVTLACLLAASPLAAGTTYSDVTVSNEETTSVHGSLPGGDNSRWSTEEGRTTYSDWQNGDSSTTTSTSGNTTTTTTTTVQTRDASRTDEALNPAGRSVGTDRFDPTTTWTETRTETTVTTTTTSGNPNCSGSCGNGNGGNGTGSEGGGKGKNK